MAAEAFITARRTEVGDYCRTFCPIPGDKGVPATNNLSVKLPAVATGDERGGGGYSCTEEAIAVPV